MLGQVAHVRPNDEWEKRVVGKRMSGAAVLCMNDSCDINKHQVDAQEDLDLWMGFIF